MGTFKKIPERFKVIKMRSSYKGKVIIKKVRLFEPTYDEQVRKKDGLWIPHRKRTYLYWYKFLQLRKLMKLTIKGDKYRGWDLDSILDISFDDWWDSHWKKLFATEKKGQQPKFITSTKRIKYESIRFTYFVGCLSENINPISPTNFKYNLPKIPRTNQWIGHQVVKYELSRRYPTNSNLFYPTDKNYVPIKPHELDSEQRRMVGQEISRHKSYFKKILKNVQKGMFP